MMTKVTVPGKKNASILFGVLTIAEIIYARVTNSTPKSNFPIEKEVSFLIIDLIDQRIRTTDIVRAPKISLGMI